MRPAEVPLATDWAAEEGWNPGLHDAATFAAVDEDGFLVAELDGEPVAFMLTIPDINELIKDLNGELFPFGWVKLLWRLRKPRPKRVRVPLMGVAKKLHQTRLASQLAFMLIEYTRRDCVGKFGIKMGEFGWILEDNKGMLSIAELPSAKVNHRYRIFEKAL